ncbi:MAG: glycosyltransferase family 9 protein [Candidatus Omnitrophica bacterium]|nr:glycosyltransferase family 9 protein [Candidatus Omnitrophota bacterium]
MKKGTGKNALIVRPGSIGDSILTIPVFYSLKKASYNVFLIGCEKIIEYFQSMNLIDRGIGFGDMRILEYFVETKKVKIYDFPDFDVVFCYIEKDNKFSENLLLTFGNKVIFHPPDEKISSHMTEFLLKPLEKLKIEKCYYPHIERKRDNNVLFIHPGSGSKKKNWDKNNFLAVFKFFQNRCDCKVILGECEIDDYEFWKKNIGHNNIIMPQNISELAQILNNGSIFLGNDSGVSHLAAFSGLKTFVIFGPTNPDIWTPRGKNVKIIKSTLECSPCNSEKMRQCKDVICLQKIDPGYIISMIHQFAVKIVGIPN